MDNSVFKIVDYGKVNLTLDTVIKSKGITINKLSVLTGSKYEVIKRYCTNNIERIDLDLIARICYVLEINLNDILSYIK